MSTVYLGIGSNQDPVFNLRLCIRELNRHVELRLLSGVYRNEPVGFVGEDFLNAVVCAETTLSPQALCVILEDIHELAGRERGTNAFASRTLDVDMLLYDDLVVEEPPVRLPRADVLEYAFVLRPLAEIAPDYVHPVTGRSMAEHWSAFAANTHPLIREDMVL